MCYVEIPALNDNNDEKLNDNNEDKSAEEADKEASKDDGNHVMFTRIRIFSKYIFEVFMYLSLFPI